MSNFLVGPNPCHTCGGEYGQHSKTCLNNPQRQARADKLLLEERAQRVARGIQAMTHASENATQELIKMLVKFAEEIKRQAIEP